MADIHPFLFSQDSWFSMCDICKPVCWQTTRITLQLFENEPVSVCHSLLSDQGIPIDHYLLLLMSITADCFRHALFLDLFLRTFLYPYMKPGVYLLHRSAATRWFCVVLDAQLLFKQSSEHGTEDDKIQGDTLHAYRQVLIVFGTALPIVKLKKAVETL